MTHCVSYYIDTFLKFSYSPSTMMNPIIILKDRLLRLCTMPVGREIHTLQFSTDFEQVNRHFD